jgi:hypothetical protein
VTVVSAVEMANVDGVVSAGVAPMVNDGMYGVVAFVYFPSSLAKFVDQWDQQQFGDVSIGDAEISRFYC